MHNHIHVTEQNQGERVQKEWWALVTCSKHFDRLTAGHAEIDWNHPDIVCVIGESAWGKRTLVCVRSDAAIDSLCKQDDVAEWEDVLIRECREQPGPEWEEFPHDTSMGAIWFRSV